ncbi:MAG: hypothetical protein HY547_01855, partial [Elusimicrobia bacterium]|nr:hypothetical protein [Elusimicrobiota bacterium]
MKIIAAVVFLISLLPHWAAGYLLSDHERLTKMTFNEFNRCRSIKISDSLVQFAVESNFNEDANIMRKWFEFSHYYNPQKSLNDDWRKDAMARVRQLKEAFFLLDKQAPDFELQVFGLAGRLMHYFQDVTVPAHVVPVRHINNEGFEVYGTNGMETLFDYLESPECSAFAEAPYDPVDMFVATALATLDAVNGDFTMVCGGQTKVMSWGSIWAADEGPNFGRYGVLGNAFGKNTKKT